MVTVIGILQTAVEPINVLVRISVWSAYLVLYAFMRLVIPTPPPPPPKPPSTQLNSDVLMEIFSHYVAVQTDGALYLTLVSKSWREFVLRSPALWQWVIVDEQSSDWIERLSLSGALSGACPLQIVVRLPMLEWDPLIPLLPRCQNIFFEIPDYMTGRDVAENTEKFLSAANTFHNCKLHYYRAGKYLLDESRESMSADLSRVQNLELIAEGTEYPNYHSYARTRHPRYLELGDIYRPLVLLKLYHLLDILRNASNLRTLAISHHSMDPIFSDIGLPIVPLGNLDELRITGIDYDRNGSLIPLTQSIRCSQISTLVLSGVHKDIMDVAERIGRISNPTHLEIRYPGGIGDHLIFSSSFQLPSVTRLHVQSGEMIPEHTPPRSINATVSIASNVTSVHVITTSLWNDRLSTAVKKCVRHGLSSKDRCELECQQYAMLELTGVNVKEIDINGFTPFQDFSPDRSHVMTRISSTSLTTISCTPTLLLPILSQHPLPLLRTIRLYVPLPSHWDGTSLAELRYFNVTITWWIIKHVNAHLPLNVHTFGLSWFPNWKSLLRMLYYMSKNRSTSREFALEIPAYPHPVVQQALRLALEQTDDGTNSIPPGSLDENVSPGMKALMREDEDEDIDGSIIGSTQSECYYCRNSGLKCHSKSTQDSWLLYCERHSLTDLVTFTKNPVVDVGEGDEDEPLATYTPQS